MEVVRKKLIIAVIAIISLGLIVAVWCSSEWQTLIKLAITAMILLASGGLSISLMLKISVVKNEQTQSVNGGHVFNVNNSAINGQLLFNAGGNPNVSHTNYDEVTAVKVQIDPNSIQR